MLKKLDTGAAAASQEKGNSAFKAFQNKVDKGEVTSETKLVTKHQNAITWIAAYKKTASSVSQYSTSGLDGAVIIWDSPK